MEIDKSLIKERFRKSRETYDGEAFVQKAMCTTLIEMLFPFVSWKSLDVLELGCGTGLLTKKICNKIPVKKLYVNDLVDDFHGSIDFILKNESFEWSYIAGDAENCDLFPHNLDLVISNASFQWFKNPEKFLSNIPSHMKSGGIIAFTTFGPENMIEIQNTIGNGLIYPDFRKIKSMISGNFKILDIREELKKITLPTPRDVLLHMKKTGVTGTKRFRWTKGKLEGFIDQYNSLFSCENGVALSYHPIYVVAEKI